VPRHRAATFTPTGQLLAAGTRTRKGSADATDVHLIDPATGEARLAWQTPARATLFHLAPGGKYVVAAFDNGPVRVLDGMTGKALHTLTGPNGGIVRVAFTASGRLFATQEVGGLVRVFDPATGKEVSRLPSEGHMTTALLPGSLHPDGQRVALTRRGERGIGVTIRKPGSVAPGLDLPIEYHIVGGVAYSPDGSRVAVSGVNERVVGVWDVETGAERLMLRRHPETIVAMAFAPNDRYLAVACTDGRVLVWDVSPIARADQ
jgi:WD40 repeat protein